RSFPSRLVKPATCRRKAIMTATGKPIRQFFVSRARSGLPFKQPAVSLQSGSAPPAISLCRVSLTAKNNKMPVRDNLGQAKGKKHVQFDPAGPNVYGLIGVGSTTGTPAGLSTEFEVGFPSGTGCGSVADVITPDLPGVVS